MDRSHREELRALARGRIRFDSPMAQHTTLCVGGPVEALYEAKDLEDLARVVAYLNRGEIPYLPLGRGSNLLIIDEGLKGVMVMLRGSLAAIKEGKKDDTHISAGGGLGLSDLLSCCRRRGLRGLEFLAGIPGTVGGAIAMNAGAFGEEIGDRVKSLQVLTRTGERITMDRSQLKFSYRKLELEEASVVVQGVFTLDPDAREGVETRISRYLKKKKATQPLDLPSAGSVFKNPPGDFAGRLIEGVGLKGKRIGGAMISEKHANFIVNISHATARDILALMRLAMDRVKKETGIELEPEIQVLGS